MGQPIIKSFCMDLTKPISYNSTYIVYSTSKTPPKRCDETVKELYELQWSTVPDFNSLPTWKNPLGKTIRQIDFEIKMISNGVTLDFEIIYEGEVLASKNIKIDYGHCGALASDNSRDEE